MNLEDVPLRPWVFCRTSDLTRIEIVSHAEPDTLVAVVLVRKHGIANYDVAQRVALLICKSVNESKEVGQ